MAEDIKRPFDLLDQLKGERMAVTTKDDAYIVGELVAFDQHNNLAIKDVEVHAKDEITELSQLYLRGQNIRFVHPEDGDNGGD